LIQSVLAFAAQRYRFGEASFRSSSQGVL
jgi:hypothetical protein